MSTTRMIRIRCDYGPSPREPQCCGTVETIQGTARAVRAYLRTLGWRYVAGHPTTGPGRDLCPEHADTAREDQP